MKRKIIKTEASWRKIKMDGFADDPATWLLQKMQAHHLEREGPKADEDEPTTWLLQKMQAEEPKYLLAHADDGVIWGRLAGQQLITSHQVEPKYSPPLLAKTLQTARIFADAGELLIWRDEAGQWAGRLIAEATPPGAKPEWTRAFEERQILLGTNAKLLEDQGFALMSEGSQGLFHIVPLKLEGKIDEQTRPLRLVVRHYLKADENGFVRVNASRLVDLHLEPKESNA